MAEENQNRGISEDDTPIARDGKSAKIRKQPTWADVLFVLLLVAGVLADYVFGNFWVTVGALILAGIVLFLRLLIIFLRKAKTNINTQKPISHENEAL